MCAITYLIQCIPVNCKKLLFMFVGYNKVKIIKDEKDFDLLVIFNQL